MPAGVKQFLALPAKVGKRVVTYSHCSTHRDQKPEVQIIELRRYCQARGWEIVEEIVDHGYSGTRADRPGLKKLMALVRTRQVDAVVVVKLDRLFRSLKHMIVALQELSELGVEFVSVKDQLDLTTAAGRLMLHLVSAFAEFERELIVERTILGVEHARSIGKKLGRPKAHDDSQIVVFRRQGLSYREIQKSLGCSSGAINRALTHASKSPPENTENSPSETRFDDE